MFCLKYMKYLNTEVSNFFYILLNMVGHPLRKFCFIFLATFTLFESMYSSKQKDGITI